MKVRYIASLTAAVVVGLVASSLFAAKEIKWETIKCMVSNKPVNKDATVEYKEGKVFFCCTGCPAAFARDKEKFAAKANAQLVATRQYKQEKCPLSGRDLNKETMVKVADIEVTFCCQNCQGKAKEAKGDEQLKLVFDEAAFKKGFKKISKEEEKKAE